MEELYKKYRPTTHHAVVGQREVIKSIEEMLVKNKVPHFILFTGPSGCGKTTLARILKKSLGCADADFNEMNCADFRGIDMVRDIRSRMTLSPIGGDCRIWLIDECHELTKQAQEAFLKILEDTPPHVYFFFATTDPQKLKKTIITRSTELKVKAFTKADTMKLLRTVAKKEKIKLSKEVAEKIHEYSDGSARKSLVLLHQIQGLGEEEQLEAIGSSDTRRQAIELARLLMKPKAQWREATDILKSIDDEPETVRRMILGYCNSVILGGGPLSGRCFDLINIFRDHYYDCGKSGLAADCYEAIVLVNR